MKLTGIIAEKLATLIETQGGTIADQITKKVCGLLSDEIPGVVHRLTDTVSKEVGKNIQDKKFSEQMATNLREKLVSEQSSWLSGIKKGFTSLGKGIEKQIEGVNSSQYDQSMTFDKIKTRVTELLGLDNGNPDALDHFNKITLNKDGANWKDVLEALKTNIMFNGPSGTKSFVPDKENLILAFKLAVKEAMKNNGVLGGTADKETDKEGGNAKRQTARYTKRGRNATYHHSAHGKMYNRTRKYPPRKQKSRRKQNNRKSV